MNRQMTLTTLREHAEDLRADGVVRLRLFGSTARDEASPESDVDLLADFDPDRKITLLTLSRLQQKLARILMTNVDLSSEPWLRDHVRDAVLGEALLVFQV